MTTPTINTGSANHCNSEEEYYNLIESAGDALVVVDCYADWCAPCRQIAPVFDGLAAEYPHVMFVKVNVDRLPNVSKALGVWAMPTFFFLRQGRKLGSIMGASERRLRQGLFNDGEVSICSNMPCVVQ